MMGFIQSRDEGSEPVPARIPAEGLAPAPGHYVKVRLFASATEEDAA